MDTSENNDKEKSGKHSNLGDPHFTLGLIHQKNGNLIQAGNCFLHALAVKEPPTGGEHKLIEVHRKILQYGSPEQWSSLDRDSILQALRASNDELFMRTYLAELYLREGDFHAAMEQITLCADGDHSRKRQLVCEIAGNLFADASGPEHPTRLYLDIWQSQSLPGNPEKSNIVAWFKKFKEIPEDFLCVDDSKDVLRAALERIQLGQNLSFIARQLVRGLRSVVTLCLLEGEQTDSSARRLLDSVLKLAPEQSEAIAFEGLLEIQEICENALAVHPRDCLPVLVAQLLRVPSAMARSMVHLVVHSVVVNSQRLTWESSQPEDKNLWLDELTEWIQKILLLEEDSVPAEAISEVVTPMFEALLERLDSSRLVRNAHFTGRLAPLLTADDQGSQILKNLVESRPDFVRLCERESQVPLF